jgi:hypothetical protein
MVGPKRLASLYRQALSICARDLPGNFVECGVAAGGTSALLAAVVARHSKRPRRLFACDTFEGMPATGAEDVHQGTNAEATGWGAGTCAAPISTLMTLCDQLGVSKIVTPVKGLFADSLPVNRATFGPIAFLHVDGDWYASTRDILVNLYDQVTPGGGIQIDDFGYWEGCRKAWAEFEAARGLSHGLDCIDETGVFTLKPA